MATELLASAARTASGNFAIPTALPDSLRGAVVLLDVTAAATAVDDTLDVYVQHSVDGSAWDDFIHFTQVLGNGGAKQFYARWTPLGAAPEAELGAPQDAALAAGVLQQPVGLLWRVKWVLVDAGADDASFTFSVSAHLYRGR
jgi:hypothetical protein